MATIIVSSAVGQNTNTSGTGDPDTIIGGMGNDTIAGNDGDDTISGGSGNDFLLGGRGSDTLHGQNGHDTLYGGAANDMLYGDNGDDTLSGDLGLDFLTGGRGDDTFLLNALLTGADHDVVLDFQANAPADYNPGILFNDTLSFNNVGGKAITYDDVDGRVEIKADGNIVAYVEGVNAQTALLATDFNGSPSSVKLNDASSVSFSGTTGDDELEGVPGIENVISGNSGNDTINGQGKNDTLLGGPGMDTLNGRNGHDTLFGGGGNDVLIGGNGNDLLNGDRGSDTLTGGNGADTFEFTVNGANLGDGVDSVTDFDLGTDSLAIRNGDPSLVTFDDTGNDVSVFYDGTQIATLLGVPDVPGDTSNFFLA